MTGCGSRVERGPQAFPTSKSRNAASTLVTMAVMSIAMFVGIRCLPTPTGHSQ